MTRSTTLRPLAVLLAAMVTVGCKPDASFDPTKPIIADFEEYALRDGAVEAVRRGRRGLTINPVVVRIEGDDGYGHDITLAAFTLTWKSDDLARVQWSQIGEYQMLELAELQGDKVDSIHGARALNSWCGDENNQTLTPRFCRRWSGV